MIPLLKMYDDFTSNKYVSMGISVASTAFIIYESVTSTWYRPKNIIIGICAGSAFALITKTYLVYSESIKDEGARNSIYATLSLVNLSAYTSEYNIVYRIFYRVITNPLYSFCGLNLCAESIFEGFKVGFSTTNLTLQILEGKTPFKFKLQSPFVFE